MKAPIILVLVICVIAVSFFVVAKPQPLNQSSSPLTDSREKHLKNIKQLTNEGENAEAYFSQDGKRLIFQRTTKRDGCDQIFSMNIDGSDMKMLSNGEGKTTCAYFTPDKKHVVYASTFKANPVCPPPPDYSRGYVWSLFPGFDIFVADLDGKNAKPLTTTSRYDAEATIRKDGTIVFTSLRDGDLDIYTMDKNGRNVKKLTNEIGYDGGPFWSADGKQIVYRAFHPENEKEKADYLALLKDDLIRPTKLDIWVMNADGSNKRRVTNINKASFAPYFFPDGKRIIFSSNMDDPRGRNFDLYTINVDGSNLERITFSDLFDGFPMFSPDGKKLVFCSNRNAAKQGDTNVFIADWQP
ncbi:MAG: PD40 domain-containing protein [Acidobacteria bacterium]|nr:PD40 domain-containing protein [Acidobacteriota bacterium]